MNWLRGVLREWLFPKADEVSASKAVETAIKRMEKENKRVLDAKKKILQDSVAETRHFLFESRDKIMEDAARRINEEMVPGMFYRFPEKKMVSVKQVVKSLLDYHDLELAIRKDPNDTRELVAKIVRKKAKEKKVKPAKKE